jgi:hypothetical protein
VNALYSSRSVTASLFADADAQYATMKEALTSEDFHVKTEAEVQRWLTDEQHELMRRLMQAFITLRGQAQVQEPVVGADGETRTHQRHGASRQLETVFGTVEAGRTGHSGRGLSTLYPVDASLNLPEARYSLEVERQIAMAAARLSFDEALEMVGRMTGAHVPKRQAEEAVQRAARDFEAFYAVSQLECVGPTSEFLVLTFDQKGVVLRREDLTEATRKAAESSRSKMDTRGSKGEPKRGRKRMAAVAAVYTVAPYVRTAQDVIAGLRHIRDATKKPRPRPEGKRVWASLTRELKDVIAEAFDEAEDRDPEHRKRWLVLVDGDNKLTRWVRAEARRRGVEVTLVLDFIHALEYLWKAAHVFFNEGNEEIEAWVLERLERMLEGDISNVVAGMTRMATVRGLSAKDRKPVDTAARYLLKRKGMMRYDELLALGTPIATGIIEGACRHLINDRMDLTGARWRLLCAEAVLRLRSLISSGDFDQYWHFHEAVEFHRNHASRYANGDVPPVVQPTRRAHLRVLTSVE